MTTWDTQQHVEESNSLRTGPCLVAGNFDDGSDELKGLHGWEVCLKAEVGCERAKQDVDHFYEVCCGDYSLCLIDELNQEGCPY